MEKNNPEEKDFLSFIQESGLIWGPAPEIYGGLAGFYVYGPLGKLLKNKIENSIRKLFNINGFREIEGPTILPDIVWKASGHLDTFSDRTIKCSKCNSQFRADKLIEEKLKISGDAMPDEQILKLISENKIKCPSCSSQFENKLNRQSLMVKTKIAEHNASLRPETATVTYLPFPRFNAYFRKKLPFTVFQIGKAYRNEISPRQHVLRMREFTQAEAQIFLDPLEKNSFDKFEEIKKESLPLWDHKSQTKNQKHKYLSLKEAIDGKIIKTKAYAWAIWLAHQQFINFGIPIDKIRLRQHQPDEKAFYAEDAWDIEINLNNYGWTEVCGVHDRTDYDLKQHSKFSGVKLEAQRENNTQFTPHIIEIAFGTDRPLFALIDLFYEKKSEKEGKTTFKIPYNMAPIEIAIFPLLKKPELTALAQKIRKELENNFIIEYDESGSIGRRYLRAAMQGIPYSITIDFESLEKKDITIRDRNSEKQIRVPINNLDNILKTLFSQKTQFEKAGKIIK